MIGVLRERSDEPRVSLVPQDVAALVQAGFEVVVEHEAGIRAGFRDKDYEARGARTGGKDEVLAAEVLVQVRAYGADRGDGEDVPAGLRPGHVTVGLGNSLGNPAAAQAVAKAGVTSFCLELLPRTTRAQAMDVLSSQAVLAGYRAALVGAERLAKVLPMMSTAAGTLPPAKVLVVGAGVAGLSAIATARRLGALVSAYDVRPEAREQVESVGGMFVALPLDTSEGSAGGGYAAAMGEDFYRRQQELLAATVASSDIVITTAQVPGRRAPVIVTEEMVRRMAPGSVVVDIAAAQGGNCEVTRPDEEVLAAGVHVLGPSNIVAGLAPHASQLFSKNISNFLKLILNSEGVKLDLDDVLIAETLVTHESAVVHPAVLQRLGPEENAESEHVTPSTSPVRS
ncbi:NAD(P) transhydrogenase subunit alpha [Microtetraspora sp. NBRC 16547]|uniref:NAD(P) transhydrogenase subunit alpha n=1 Tax=Microtetraspora sp. NBRC 16547 TaxID=3030993 RepID=UPI002554EB9D|nr:NAD(P) transhydrogenase subunit alpha [Microtetraspora sp. NBRC 16547]